LIIIIINTTFIYNPYTIIYSRYTSYYPLLIYYKSS